MAADFDLDSWRALSSQGKIAWLGERELLTRQSAELSRASPDGFWTPPSRPGPHPVRALLDAGERELALEAIALGATPFGDKINSALLGDAMANLGGLGLGSLADNRPDPELFLALWRQAQPFLNVQSPQCPGAIEAAHALASLGARAYRSGALCAARALGVDAGLSWFECWSGPQGFDGPHPWLRPFFLREGAAHDLEALRQDGLDLLSPLISPEGEGAQSLWLWLCDDLPDALLRAQCLLRAGNDPRRPLAPGAPTPLQTMRDHGCAQELLPLIDAALLAADESHALRLLCASPSLDSSRARL